ncbi:RNA polymerase sigma factor [Furfurilactobacillus entadae]|uniref:RNA polymerase sigma factor n=1 Tax=Furfurilactobacillus entadae TaxID=2922307 RepID=UPI0038B36C43
MNCWTREQEDEVIAAATSGDERAFEQLFQQYMPLVGRWYHRLNFSAPALDYDDWQQECRLVLVTTLTRYRGRSAGEFGTYFKRNVCNRGFDLKRQQNALKRRLERLAESLDDGPGEMGAFDVPAQQPDGLGLTQLHEYLAQMSQALSPFEHQVWVALIHGQSPEWMASRWACSDNQIRNAVNRCHGKLQQVFVSENR